MGKIERTRLNTHSVPATGQYYFNCKCRVGRPKKAFSSETDKKLLGTTFSHYLGIKQCRKLKIENFYTFFHPVQALRSFTT